jgi:hypothetical protein
VKKSPKIVLPLNAVRYNSGEEFVGPEQLPGASFHLQHGSGRKMRYISLLKTKVRLLFSAIQFPDCVSSCSNVDDDDDDSYLIVKYVNENKWFHVRNIEIKRGL